MADKTVSITLTSEEADWLWHLIAEWRVKGPIKSGDDLKIAKNIHDQIKEQAEKKARFYRRLIPNTIIHKFNGRIPPVNVTRNLKPCWHTR